MIAIAIGWFGSVAFSSVRFLAAALLASVLVFGGASRGAVLETGAIQIVGGAVLALWVWNVEWRALSRDSIVACVTAATFALWSFVQTIPLPPEIWTMLPGRADILASFQLFDGPLPWLPISLTPENFLTNIFLLVPPAAIFCLIATQPSRTANTAIAWVVILVGSGSALLSVFQQFLKHITVGAAEATTGAGFFANANHQATFLLAALPFAAMHLSRISLDRASGDIDFGRILFMLAVMATHIAGIAVAGSGAGLVLLVPALLLSAAVYLGAQFDMRGIIIVFVGAAGAVLVASTFLNLPSTPAALFSAADASQLDRPAIYARTMQAILDHFPVGTGSGSFEMVYRSYENPADVSNVFVNHAHNDYLELVLEAGAGAFIALGGLALIVSVSISAWRLRPSGDIRMRRAASVAILLILTHSLADYPLRTAAIACLAAACAGILMQGWGAASRDDGTRARQVDL